MVGAVSNIPYFSYLGQLQGGKSTANTPVTTPTKPSTDNKQSAALVSSLLGTGGYAPSVLSVLQENPSAGFDPVSTILGGSTATNGLTKLYSNLYDSATALRQQTAQINSPKATTSTSAIQNLIDSGTKASVASNVALQQSVAADVKAAQTKTNSVISLIS